MVESTIWSSESRFQYFIKKNVGRQFCEGIALNTNLNKVKSRLSLKVHITCQICTDNEQLTTQRLDCVTDHCH